MLEIPESAVISEQIERELKGRAVTEATAGKSPHRFAWFSMDPAEYGAQLVGRRLVAAVPRGGMVELDFNGVKLALSDGANPRLYRKDGKRPEKHQLEICFDDGSALIVTVAMYGGITLFEDGKYDNKYYLGSREKPSPLSDEFDYRYFSGLFIPECEKLSLKAFLATEQRIPGLGNGVLQDILFEAGMNPRKKVSTLDEAMKRKLFGAVKSVLVQMLEGGGRDLESDFYGRSGGYITRAGRGTAGSKCRRCGEGTIKKENYLGGSVYYCDRCQVL